MKKITIFWLGCLLLLISFGDVLAADATILYKKGNDSYKQYDPKNRTTNKFLDNALEYLNKAIQADSNYGQAYFTRGHVYVGKKIFNKAINDYSKAISLDFIADSQTSSDDTRTYVYTSRGIAYLLSGERKKGASDLLTACGLGNTEANEAACEIAQKMLVR